MIIPEPERQRFTFWVRFGYSESKLGFDWRIMERVIIHVDINSCFASCEQQDHPEWRGKPLGVVQDSGKRSVIIGSSMEAKRFGVGTGTLIHEARRMCPDIIIVPANFERYAGYSKMLRQVCQDYSYRSEVFSIDELFIDVTKTAHLFGGPRAIALAIKRRLKEEVGDWLKCSIGIGPNKMLAKLASGSQKPDGLVIVEPEKKLEFLDRHELWHICGIGDRIQRRLRRMGIYTIAALRQTPVDYLKREFGVMGRVYSDWARGIDTSLVAKVGEIDPDKSYGSQLTLAEATTSFKESQAIMLWLSWQVVYRMREQKTAARSVSLALRYNDSWGYAQKTMIQPGMTAEDIYRVAQFIYRHKLNWRGPVQFFGLSVGRLTSLATTPLPLLSLEQKRQRLTAAVDQIAKKYGLFYLRPAALLHLKLKQHVLNGFSRKF